MRKSHQEFVWKKLQRSKSGSLGNYLALHLAKAEWLLFACGTREQAKDTSYPQHELANTTVGKRRSRALLEGSHAL